MGHRPNRIFRKIVGIVTVTSFVIMGIGVIFTGLVVALVNMIGRYEEDVPVKQSDWTAEDWKDFWGDEQ
jgi:hypothetical protein